MSKGAYFTYKRRCYVIAEKGTSQEMGSFEVGGSGKPTERGYYGQALREGLMRPPPPVIPRAVNILLWVLNVVIGFLLMAFIGWRLYTIYLV